MVWGLGGGASLNWGLFSSDLPRLEWEVLKTELPLSRLGPQGNGQPADAGAAPRVAGGGTTRS
jgi:hypothetical protein